MEKGYAEGCREGRGLFIRRRCAHRGQRRSQGQHAEAGIKDARDPPCGRCLGKMQLLKSGGRYRKVRFEKRHCTDDDCQRSHERRYEADHGGELAKSEPDRHYRRRSHYRRACDNGDAEVLVERCARAREHYQVTAADEDGTEPVEYRADRFSEIIGEQRRALLFRKLLTLVEQFPREQKVDDEGNDQRTDRALDPIGYEERQTFRAGCEAGADAGAHKGSAELQGCGKLDLICFFHRITFFLF